MRFHLAMAWLGLAVLQANPVAARAQNDDPPQLRRVVVRVVDEEGVPMAGVAVHLVGLERDALDSFDFLRPTFENSPPDLRAWTFSSDVHGRFIARFGCFRTWRSEETAGKWAPRWGYYYFVAEARGLRGVSPQLVHSTDELLSDWELKEMARIGTLRTGDRPLRMTMRMRRGLRVEGHVIDARGQPVKGFELRLWNDLKAHSHTGMGGEIFTGRVDSDDQGRFAFARVFPSTFYLDGSRDEDRLPVWVATHVRGRWIREAVDIFTPRRGERIIHLTLQVSRHLYRYFGRVTTPSGKPIGRADLRFAVSRHRVPRTFADEHTGLHAISMRTDATNFSRPLRTFAL